MKEGRGVPTLGFNCYAPRAAMPSGEEAWKRLLEDCLENPNSLDILSQEQRERGQQHWAWIRLMDLKRAHKTNFFYLPKHEKRLREEYLERYCGHYMDDSRWKYKPDDEVKN